MNEHSVLKKKTRCLWQGNGLEGEVTQATDGGVERGAQAALLPPSLLGFRPPSLSTAAATW